MVILVDEGHMVFLVDRMVMRVIVVESWEERNSMLTIFLKIYDDDDDDDYDDSKMIQIT